MQLTTFLPSLLLSATIPQLASACAPPVHRRQEAAAAEAAPYPRFDLGPDEPSPPETIGYFVNHLAINVRNATESIEFYNRAFGLRHIFTQTLTEHFTVTYLGHSAGGRNGTGFQTVSEINRDKNNRYGMLELLSINGIDWDVQRTSNGLHHIGIIVPDIEVAQKRFEEVGAKIIKPFGAAPDLQTPPYVGLTALPKEELDLAYQGLLATNSPLIWIEDPSGNMIEVQGQEGFALGQ